MNRFLVYSVVFIAFSGLFAWAYFTPEPNTKDVHASTEEGFFEDYAYIITSSDKQKEKSANFNPAIKGEDSAVVAMLREVIRTAYDERVPDDLQPVVEELHETNYVTFTNGGNKTYFQLFKDDSGEVGSVSFWREQAK